MDGVRQRQAAARRETPVFRHLPAAAPLAMPVQRLRGAEAAEHDQPARAEDAAPLGRPRLLGLRRLLVFAATIAMTALGGAEMYLVLSVGGLTVLEGIVLGLFVLLFAWIGLSFVSSLAGFVLELAGPERDLGIDPAAPLPSLGTRNALLLPTYNEDPQRVMARLQAIYESVSDTGQSAAFDFFILSDTRDPDIWIAEEAAWLDLLRRTGSDRIFYRHRAENTARKAGNIGEWVTRFGAAYAHMIVLDADSLMTGDAVVRLVAALERHPQVALIQTLPVIVNGTTLFARLQQFASRLYGPPIARGIAWWHGPDGNYWGHNAAIRIAAFARHAGLPTLPGRRPFGGHILSHDFVEAALMRRAGWAIQMVPSLRGSYEETPPSLVEYTVRDRRWCQGNLQHLAVMRTEGLRWVSRLHLATGIGSYVSAPLWVVMLLVGLLISLEAEFVRPEYFPKGFSLFPTWPAQDPVRAAWVFAGTMGLLIVPKLLAYLDLLARRARRLGFGGAVRALAGMLIEIVVSGLIAPVMMISQSRAVVDVVLGRDSGWQAQRRDSAGLPMADAFRQFAFHTAAGVLLAAGAYAVSLPLFLWMMPVTVGLVLAVPMASLTASERVGNALRRIGLLATPEERDIPAVLARANELYRQFATAEAGDALTRLSRSAGLREAHRAMLEPPRPRPRGEVDPDLAIARAKLETLHAQAEARVHLGPREKMAALADPATFDRLLQLA
jgi:membrane glycosyltransferase